MAVVDLSGQGLFEFDASLITPDTTEVRIPDNQLTSLPPQTFKGRSHIWILDFNGNFLADLSYLKCFGALGYLDLRNNCLAFDELLDITHVYVAHVRLDGNPFSKLIEDQPLTLPALLDRAWIIDGEFISDYTRRLAKSFRETIAFGETILACRRIQTTISPLTGVSQVAMTFLSGDTVQFGRVGEVISSAGVLLKSLDRQPQIERLRHLAMIWPPKVGEGGFVDYFGLALGILSAEWMNGQMDLIPRMICHDYWVWSCEGMQRLEPYERLLVLLKIVEMARPTTEVEKGLWRALDADKFLQTGEVPMHGATPRLLISAFVERIHERPADTVDRLFYLKLREHARFTTTLASLDEIYTEIVAPLPVVAPNWPLKGAEVLVRHPVTDHWVSAVCLSCKKGRVVTQAGTDVVQIPLIGMFWDGKVWREARRLSEAPRRRPLSELGMVNSDEESMSTSSLRSSSQASGERFPTMPEPEKSDTRALLHTGIRLLGTSQFIDRGSAPPPVFRGIVGPLAPPHTAIVRAAPRRRPTQYIQDVVNVTWGADIGYGRKLRKFNVRVENTLTRRSQYQWVTEDQIAPEDVERLTALYRKHIESKLTIIPGL
jgi:hypothetical protein